MGVSGKFRSKTNTLKIAVALIKAEKLPKINKLNMKHETVYVRSIFDIGIYYLIVVNILFIVRYVFGHVCNVFSLILL